MSAISKREMRRRKRYIEKENRELKSYVQMLLDMHAAKCRDLARCGEEKYRLQCELSRMTSTRTERCSGSYVFCD